MRTNVTSKKRVIHVIHKKIFPVDKLQGKSAVLNTADFFRDKFTSY